MSSNPNSMQETLNPSAGIPTRRLLKAKRPQMRRMSGIPFTGFSLTRVRGLCKDAKHKAVIRVLTPILSSFRGSIPFDAQQNCGDENETSTNSAKRLANPRLSRRHTEMNDPNSGNSSAGSLTTGIPICFSKHSAKLSD